MASDVLMKELDWSWKKKICSQIGARCDSVSSSMRSRRTWNGVELDCGNERRWTPMIDDRYVTDVTTRSDWKNGPCDAIESTPVEPRPMGGNNNNNNMKKNKKKSPFFLVLSFQSLEDAGKHPVAIRRKGGGWPMPKLSAVALVRFDGCRVHRGTSLMPADAISELMETVIYLDWIFYLPKKIVSIHSFMDALKKR